MKNTLLFLSFLLLAGCGVRGTSISEQNQNPLTAARYGDELANALADLIIQNDPIAEDPGMKARIQDEIEQAKKIGNNARNILNRGSMGPLIPIKEDMEGWAAYTNGTLYLSSDFYTRPGPSLRVYLTTVVDPRDVDFPDETAIDLGEIQSMYGAQEYAVNTDTEPRLLRTVALYDTTLQRLFGFAQLSQR